ncbi:MAG: T9SS type A sorting domain-containing protein [Bacteroidota bacterium]
MRKKLSILSISICGFINLINSQTTITLNPFQDNTLYESVAGNISNGAGDHLFSGTTNSGLKRRALLLFDLSSIPSGATISDVSLTLTADQTTAGARAMSLYSMSSFWGEGTSVATGAGGNGAVATTDDATWQYSFYPVTNWTTPGGDFDATAIATTSVNGNGTYVWTSSDMKTYVQNFVNGTGFNLGWILIGDESSTQTAKRFGSRENTDPLKVPSLSITYSAPCVNPDLPTLNVSAPAICLGSTATITVTGNLNSATLWHLYADGCGITPLDSNAIGSFDVSPTSATTYYIRGEGGCVSSGACENISIGITPNDDPSFNYSGSVFCQNDANPSPTITGASGGLFSASSEGIVLNPISGKISLDQSSGGTYTVTYTTAGPGCVASADFILTINPSYSMFATATICDGQTYTLGTQTLTTSGDYSEEFSSVAGCDSIINLTLIVNFPTTFTQNVTICSGSNLVIGTNTYSSDGTYIDILTGFQGCDSTLTTNLTVLAPITSSQTLVLCAGGEIIVGTNTYSTNGTYNDVLISAFGCDSTVTTDLTILPAITTSQVFTNCAGTSITVGTNTYNSTGVYTDVFVAANLCDSTVTTDLTILPENSTTQNITVCDGGSTTVGTSIYSVSGTYTDIFTAFNLCDSAVTTNFTILAPIATFQTVTLCDGGSMTVGSSTYSATGNYVDHFTSAFGCDSVVTTNLTILAPISTPQTIVVCAGANISVGSNTYSSTGTYTDVISSYFGCDSTVTTDLTVLPPNTASQSFTICYGSSINVGSSIYNSNGIFSNSFIAFNGCDSTLTTFLTVQPENTNTSIVSLCEGSSVTVGTNVYTSTGIYTDVFTSANLCDSTIITNLTIIPTVNTSQDITLCFGGDYSIGSNTYNATGTYIDHLIAFSGCDSIVTTNLTINPDITNAQTVLICSGSSINVGTSTYSTAGIFTDILTSFDGCDSTLTTTLIVNSPVANSQTLVLCDGASVTLGSSTYSSTGIYTDIFTNSNGCDSVLTTDLTVMPAIVSSQNFTYCQGGSVSVGSSTYTATGTYVDVQTAFNGCDSTVTTDLTIIPTSSSSQTLVICGGTNISVGSNIHLTSGIYVDVLTAYASNGCDSTVTTNLTVLPIISTNQSVTICFGGSLTVGSSSYNETGIYIDVFTSFEGCDSTVTTDLIVSPANTQSQTLTVCSGASVNVGTSIYTSSGIYNDVLNATNGCDSLLTTNLTVSPALTGSQALIICNGSSVTVGASSYNTTGIFTDVLTAFDGCDSTVTTNLVVLPAIVRTQSFIICAGGSVSVGTSTYNSTGVYTDLFLAHNGCDSTVTTNLTVSPAITSTQSFTLCAGSSVSVGTSTYNSSGIYTDIITATNGCDSAVTTNLIVLPAISGTQTLTICSGLSLIVGSSTYTATGVYSDVLTASNGCDSTVTTNLTVNQVITSNQTLTVCAGSHITVGSNTYSATGIYTDIVVATNGCDSTITTNLTVSPAITGSQLYSLCAGSSLTVGSSVYTTSGTYIDVLASWSGCDSTVTTGLTINPAITSTQNVSICAGANFMVGASTYNTSGTYTDVLTATNGCDSTLTTVLNVNPIITDSQTLTICNGSSITVGTNTYASSGTYSDMFITSSGCDSVLTTYLTVSPAISVIQTFTICAGTSVSVGANNYSASGTYTDMFVASNGCDSVLTTNLTVSPAISMIQTYTICAGASLSVGSSNYTSSGTYSDVLIATNGCDSTVTTNLSVNQPIIGSQTIVVCFGGSVTVGTNIHDTTGVYSDVLIAYNGCDSVVTTILNINNPIESYPVYTICDGDSISIGSSTYYSSGTYTDILVAASGCDSAIYSTLFVNPAIAYQQAIIVCAGGSVNVGTNTYNSSGIYTDLLTSTGGCDSTVITNLTVSPIISGTQSISVCSGDSIMVGNSIYNSSGVYTDVLTSMNGCDSILTTTLLVRTAINSNQSFTLCNGGSVFVGSNQYITTGIYTDILTSYLGCDSIVTTNLTINSLPNATMAAFTTPVCAEDAPFALTNGSPSGGVYSGIGVSSSPIFTPIGSGIGSFVITYTVTNGNGCSNSATATITVHQCAGVEEYTFANDLDVYPNPSEGLFTISMGNVLIRNLFISVFDIQGREVYSLVDSNLSGDYVKQVNLESLSKGIYYLKVSDGKSSKVQKIIIQ